MSKPLKVLFLFEDLCYGGTQKQNLALAIKLDRLTFAPTILTLTGPTDLDADVVAGDMPLIHMGTSRKVAPLFFMHLGRYLKVLKPDILILCTALPNIWGRIWGHLTKVPVIIGTCRGGGALARQHEFLLSRLTHGMVCNSRPLQQALLQCGYPESRLRYIANGVDTGRFQPNPVYATDQKIVCVARLAKDKDHKTLITAFGQIAPQFPRARLELIGEGPEEEELKGYAAATLPADIARKVHFVGAVADPAPYLADASIFALTSVKEAQPNALLEAMSCGLPVCATSTGGIPDITGDSALLAPCGNAAAVAEKLAYLLENPQAAHAMGLKGREIVVKDFSFDSMVAKHQEFFELLYATQQRA